MPVKVRGALNFCGDLMRKKREPETDEQRHERFQIDAQRRTADAAAEGEDMDARVKRSIKLFGP